MRGIFYKDSPQLKHSPNQIALNQYNRQLKRLSELLHLEHELSFYTPRHSWTMATRNRPVPIAIICGGEGHTSKRTKEIYTAIRR